MLKNTLAYAVCVTATALAVNAHAVELGKPITVPLEFSQGLTAKPIKSEIVLMNLQLSAEQQHVFNSYQPKAFSLSEADKNLPSKVSLGMNNVPVLNQGMHGSCVTFAFTAAIDSVLGKGDYVSPLCSLQLGNHLQQQGGYYPNGWDGSLGYIVLDQFMRFGAVSIEKQKAQSCGGLNEYPTNDRRTPQGAMPISDYRALSEDLYYKLYFNHLMGVDERLSDEFVNSDGVNKVFNEVKGALNNKHRVTFGTFLMIPPGMACTVGACARHNAKNDTWALTSELGDPKTQRGGHEMVITGYDDNAVAVDNQGNKHQGLFTLRNSWSGLIGDAGDFYMTYDYFKKYAIEAYTVVAR